MGEQLGSSPSEVPDAEVLLRLTWQPQDFDEDGGLLPGAFRREDLSGPEYGVSVDCASLVDEARIRKLAAEQQPRNPADRVAPLLVPAQAAIVRAAAGNDGPGILAVHRSVQPDNDAHAHISSRRQRTKSEINEARLVLIRCFGTPASLDQYFASSITPD